MNSNDDSRAVQIFRAYRNRSIPTEASVTRFGRPFSPLIISPVRGNLMRRYSSGGLGVYQSGDYAVGTYERVFPRNSILL